MAADGSDLGAEADALRPHVGDELVDIEPGLALAAFLVALEHGFEIVFGLAVGDLDRAVQGLALRRKRHDVGGDAHHDPAGRIARQLRPVAVQGLDQDRIIEAGQVMAGAQDAVDRRHQRGAEHFGIGIHAVVAPGDAMFGPLRVEADGGRRRGGRCIG